MVGGPGYRIVRDCLRGLQGQLTLRNPRSQRRFLYARVSLKPGTR